MVAEPRQNDAAPTDSASMRRTEAPVLPGPDAGGNQHLLPGLCEQVPGTDVRPGSALRREEELFGGGFTFGPFGTPDAYGCKDLSDPFSGFAKIRIETYRDTAGNLKTSSVTTFDDGTEKTITQDAEGRTRRKEEKTPGGGQTRQEIDKDGQVRSETIEKDNKLSATERNFDGSKRTSVLDLKTGENKITATGADGQPIKDRSDQRLVSDLTAELNAAAQADKFAGAVGIAKLGGNGMDVLYQGALGDANRETGAQNTVDTRFRLASMGKMFTGVAIMQLAEAGRLGKNGIDTKISELLPSEIGDYFKQHPKPNGDEITVRDLLEHKAGLGDMFGKTFDQHKDDADFRTLDGQLKRFFQDSKERGEPTQETKSLDSDGQPTRKLPEAGEFGYSNFGFLLLGKIVEQNAVKANGDKYKDFADYVQEKIFKPAGMTRSGFEPEDRCLEGRATNYMDDGAFGVKTADPTLPYRGGPAGGGYSTVPDLLRFGQALANGSLFQDREKGKENFLSNGGKVHDFANYGFGRYDETKDGIRSIYHLGGAEGMNTAFRYYPEQGYISVVLSNLGEPAAERIDNYIHDRLPRDRSRN